VNEKIEAFFELCRARGLNDVQGVVIPEAGVKNLMLREKVIDSVRQGQFHIWAVQTVDEGIEILTHTPAGERQADGTWEQGTVNARVDERLHNYAQRLRDFSRPVEFSEPRERAPADPGPRAPRVRSWRLALRRFWSGRRIEPEDRETG
jgi:hypothetical protein